MEETLLGATIIAALTIKHFNQLASITDTRFQAHGSGPSDVRISSVLQLGPRRQKPRRPSPHSAHVGTRSGVPQAMGEGAKQLCKESSTLKPLCFPHPRKMQVPARGPGAALGPEEERPPGCFEIFRYGRSKEQDTIRKNDLLKPASEGMLTTRSATIQGINLAKLITSAE